MSGRPYVSFAEVKERVSIPDVLQALNIADQFRVKGECWIGCCPLLQHQHGPHPNENQFRIDCKKGVWLYRCFGDCAETELGGGDVIHFVKGMTGLSDQHVRFWFVEHFGDRLSTKGQTPKRDPSEEIAVNETVVVDVQHSEQNSADHDDETSDATPITPLRFRLNLDPDVAYLRQRGLREDTIRYFGLGLCHRGILKGYCAIPVYRYPRETDDENPVAYLGRWPGENFDEAKGNPRYKWPNGFEKSHVVYGLQEALQSSDENEPLILVEGCFSVFHLVQLGVKGAVACFGASLSGEQTQILTNTHRSILVMFDGNKAGRDGQQLAVKKLVGKTFVRSINLPDGAEPEDFDQEQFASLIA